MKRNPTAIRLTALLLALLLGCTVMFGCSSSESGETVSPVDSGTTTGTDAADPTGEPESEGVFYLGGDVSIQPSLEASGVKFYDFDGNEQDVYLTMSEAGMNAVRVRVWNDPFDENGNGYGAGNCTIDTAIEIGKRAAAANMSLVVDFHYSDFWADPGKQTPPKAWTDMTVDEKAAAIYDYTTECLGKLRDAGVTVSMVQVGNETTGFFCGETNWKLICTMFKSGCDAVHDFDPSIKRIIHFTDPHHRKFDEYAKTLERYEVEYEVFASSYYPFWHGTLENLTKQLKLVADRYGKEVIVAETAWAYTFDDGDGTMNVVYEGREWLDTSAYPISVEGQKQSLIDVIAAVKAVGPAGIGVFYWEPTWIPVNSLAGLSGADYDTALEQNKLAWETYGSGWATSAAQGYDASAVGCYGGSAWDCLALFDYTGHPLDSLRAFGEAD